MGSAEVRHPLCTREHDRDTAEKKRRVPALAEHGVKAQTEG